MSGYLTWTKKIHLHRETNQVDSRSSLAALHTSTVILKLYTPKVYVQMQALTRGFVLIVCEDRKKYLK